MDLVDFTVQPAPAGSTTRFDVMPSDVLEELGSVVRDMESARAGAARPFLLATRRMRDFFNSNGRYNRPVRRRNPINPLYMNPADLAGVGATDGDRIAITSGDGEVVAIARSDPSLRTGVVALAHGWGGLDAEPIDQAGTCVNRLTNDVDAETINAMPRMSAIAVSLARVSD
jgi:anaerobic selenocysteine-containing dehydrogenase